MDRKALIDVLDEAEEIEQAPSLEAIVGGLRRALERFGFTAALVTGLPDYRAGRWHDHLLVNAWPHEWYRRYLAAGHYRHDPCAALCRASADPFSWDMVASGPLEAPQRRVMDEASEFRLRQGICVPIHTPEAPASVVTVAGETIDPDPQTPRFVHILGLHAYRGLKRVLATASRPWPRLTAREREVLQWLAAGKTAWEASRILSISENTVLTHLRHAKQKLDTVNVVHTVVEALRRREIHL